MGSWNLLRYNTNFYSNGNQLHYAYITFFSSFFYLSSCEGRGRLFEAGSAFGGEFSGESDHEDCVLCEYFFEVE